MINVLGTSQLSFEPPWRKQTTCDTYALYPESLAKAYDSCKCIYLTSFLLHTTVAECFLIAGLVLTEFTLKYTKHSLVFPYDMPVL